MSGLRLNLIEGKIKIAKYFYIKMPFCAINPHFLLIIKLISCPVK
jgi:hypothetical protein